MWTVGSKVRWSLMRWPEAGSSFIASGSGSRVLSSLQYWPLAHKATASRAVNTVAVWTRS